MPILQGIKIHIISQRELKVHPEFPHPESSHTSSHDAGLSRDRIQANKYVFDNGKDDNADLPIRPQTSVSVYIPSMSGSRFWIQWTVADPNNELAQWYYFKLFMNGRHIASWGTNAYTNPSGQVMRGLFEPSDRWNYKSDGVVYKNMGTESRPFIFAQEGAEKSAANDGGLIEVRVFRALARKRKLAKPTDFKDQEAYGIVMPSGGLLDKPQDSKFFDWHLKDPTDCPFAVFKYHYRSWDSLYALSLIPDGHDRNLLSPTRSILSILGCTEPIQFGFESEEDGGGDHGAEEDVENDMDWEEQVETPVLPKEDVDGDSMTSERSDTPWLTTVFDDSPRTIQERERRSSVGLQYDTAHISPDPRKVDLISKFSAAAAESPRCREAAVRSKRKKKTILDRPLPEIPHRQSSKRATHSRNSSAASGAPSITPSLWSYVERGQTFSPEPFLNTAQAVVISTATHYDKPHMIDVLPPIPKIIPTAKDSPPSNSPENSPPAASILKHLLIPTKPSKITPPSRISSAKHNSKPLENSPLTDFFNQPNIANITVRKHKRSPGNLLARLSISGSPFKNGSPFRSNSFSKSPDIAENKHELITAASFTTTISESEWMCRTPSPRKNSERTRYENIWSPSPGEDGKKKLRQDIESSIKTSGSLTIRSGNANAEMVKVVGSGSMSRERFTQKAKGWLDSVGRSRDDNVESSSVTGSVVDDDVKVRSGWI